MLKAAVVNKLFKKKVSLLKNSVQHKVNDGNLLFSWTLFFFFFFLVGENKENRCGNVASDVKDKGNQSFAGDVFTQRKALKSSFKFLHLKSHWVVPPTRDSLRHRLLSCLCIICIRIEK